MFGAFSKEQQLRSFLRAKERVCKEAAEGAFWGWQVETKAEGGSRSPSKGTWPPCMGRAGLLCLTFPSEGRTRFIAWESGEPFVGSHCFQEGVQRLRWAYPSWCHSQAAPARTQPSPHQPPLPPLRACPVGRPLRASRSWPRRLPSPLASAAPGPTRAPGIGPARKQDLPSRVLPPPPPRPSSSCPPAPQSAPRPCAQACPAPSPPPSCARPPPPSRRTYPLADRPRTRDRDRAERSRRASAAPPARAPSGSELRAELSCLAPRHPRG